MDPCDALFYAHRELHTGVDATCENWSRSPSQTLTFVDLHLHFQSPTSYEYDTYTKNKVKSANLYKQLNGQLKTKEGRLGKRKCNM